MEVRIDGVRYLPATDLVAGDVPIAHAVAEAATALYLYGKHDKGNRSALWTVLRHLAPNVAALAADDPRAAMEAAEAHARRAEAGRAQIVPTASTPSDK